MAALILLLAVVNYTSLSTARSATRAKEVGVRKVMGAGRGAVARQFFVESALYTSIAFLLGVALCLAAQPAFFRFLQIDVDTSFFYHPSILGSFALLFLLTLLLAALYPSAVLSAYKPVKVLYGKFVKEKGGFNIRNAFTIFQFTAAVALIICSAVVYSQLQFFRNTNTGVARENVLMLPFDAAAGPHQAAIKAQLQALPGVQGQAWLCIHCTAVST